MISFFYSLLNNIKTKTITKTTNVTTTTSTTTTIISSDGGKKYTLKEWEILFFKVMRNIYIRKEIFHHIYLFNIHRNTIFSYSGLMSYKYKEYCTILEINDNHYITSNKIPYYINTISFGNDCELDENILSKLPNSITSLKLNNNIPIKIGIISKNIKVLMFLPSFKKELIDGFIPGTVEQVYFHKGYIGKDNISLCAIPEGVKILHLPFSGNKICQGFLPKTLKELSIGKLNPWEITSCITEEGIIPYGVTKLTLDNIISNNVYYENCSLNQGVIPSSVTYLEFKSLTAEIKEFSIPSSVKTLIFGSYSRVLNPNVLPNSITYCDLGDSFNQILVKGLLPDSIKYLIMGKSFSKKLNKSIPHSIEYLKFGRSFNVKLETGDLFDSTIEDGISNCNLRTLIFGESFNKIIECNVLPNSIEYLEFGMEWNNIINNNSLPLSLKKLIFGSNYNKSIDSQYQLPSNLEEITFGFDFNSPLLPFISLPNNGSLKYLNLGRSYNNPIEIGTFPDSLTTIKFGYSFHQPLSLSQLPNSIKLLQLPSSYDLNLLSTDIPDNIIEKPNQT